MNQGVAYDPELLQAALDQDLAQSSFLDFCRHTVPGFQGPRHVRYLAGLLERVLTGDIKRLAISAPPGHGKSTLLQAFVAFFLGHRELPWERRRVLAISATESLAKRNSRDIQSLVTSDAWPWPDVTLANDSVLEWSTTKRGDVRAIGYGGTVTGFRAEGAIVDDLQPDAGSDTTRAAYEAWFREVLSTRLEPDGFCLVIQTRWHDDDIIGRLQAGESAAAWTFVNLPVFAGEEDILGREPGEVLWPERWPIETLLDRKAEVGSQAFSAQYQGDPVPAGGATFRAEWFTKRYQRAPDRYSDFLAMTIDGAWKTGLHNDPSAIAVWGTNGQRYSIVDCWKGRVEFPDLKAMVIEKFLEHRPHVVIAEQAASGFALLQELQRETNIPIIGVVPRGSKEARAQAVTPLFESGRVELPESAPWLADWIQEHLRFPSSAHDDQVDTTSLALLYLHERNIQAIESRRFREQLKGWSIGR